MNIPKNILFTSPISTCSGYGECARDFAKYIFYKFTKSNINLLSTRWGACSLDGLSNDSAESDKILKSIINLPPKELADISFHMTMPNEFNRFGKFNIGLTAGIEANKCTESFLVGCNKMDLVIVPSTFTKETLMKTQYGNLKCNVPIEVVFEGYSPQIVNPIPSKTLTHILNDIEESFCFLSVGQWADGNIRKDMQGLIKTFYDTFKNIPSPPALILKTNGTSHCIKDELRIHKNISEIKESFKDTRLPNVYLLYGNMTTTEMATMYSHKKVKCFVSFTRGEGFGRPLLEASIHALPIIVSKWSGHMDFLNKKYTKLISGKLIPTDSDNNFFPSDAEWFQVDYNLANSHLTDMVDRYDVHRKRATKLAEINKREYSLENMFIRYDEVLDNYLLLNTDPTSNFKTNIL